MLSVQNPQMTYSWKISAYIEEKSAKGSLHRVFPIGNQDLVYEVMLRDKGGLGTGPSDITMECQLWPEVTLCTSHLEKLTLCTSLRSTSSHLTGFGGPHTLHAT